MLKDLLLECELQPVFCAMVRFSRFKQSELSKYNDKTLTVMCCVFFCYKGGRQGESEVCLG